MNRCECCGVDGDRVFTMQFNNKTISICFACHSNYLIFGSSRGSICPVCDDVQYTIAAREQFNDKIMCDTCFDESCHNALNSGNGDSIIDTQAFNEIKQTNLRRK